MRGNHFLCYILFFTLILFFACKPEIKTPALLEVELNKNWEFHQEGNQNWKPTSVPNSVLTDLFATQQIENLFDTDSLKWIEKENWEYKTTFRVTPQMLKHKNIELVFNGLDTYAQIFLNDTLLLQTNNSFRTWTLNCKNHLLISNNTLRIKFLSLPKKSNSIRKPAYQFGSEISPRILSSGITKPIFLRLWDNAKILDFQIFKTKILSERATLKAVLSIFSETNQTVTISLSNKTIQQETNVVADLKQGENEVTVDFDIQSPKFWYPRGYGEAFLYDLETNLKINEKVIDSRRCKYGIKTVELIQKHDISGKKFAFRINGIDIFMKGANYIPQDMFLNRVNKERYQKLFKSVIDVNMNMLRIWGGGAYENDIFYDLCDENGILVWQDFMFDSQIYPSDTSFVENVKTELTENIKRIRNHACLALWCGNNEIENNWNYKSQKYSILDSTRIWNDYRRLFDNILPKLLKKYDNEIPYISSSPQANLKESLQAGDFHYKGVWWGGEPFTAFKTHIGRFMSAYGFPSYPTKYSESEDYDFDSKLKNYMSQTYKVPKTFDKLVYVSQIQQAEGLKIGIETHRRAKPRCMGTLYWHLNDCSRQVSFSSLDYNYDWKALHYYVKRAYNDVLISSSCENGTIYVNLVSDRMKDFRGEIKFSLMDFDGTMYWNKDFKLRVRKNISDEIFKVVENDLVRKKNPRRLVLEMQVFEKGNLLSSNLYYFASPKEQKLKKADIQKVITRTNTGFVVELKSPELMRNVYLNVENQEGYFTDNYFDLLPNRSVKVEFVGNADISKLQIVSLVDSFK